MSLVAAPNSAGTSYAQTEPRTEECKSLFTKDIKQLPEKDLYVLKSCLERLVKLREEEQKAAPSAAPPGRRAPIRIYGK